MLYLWSVLECYQYSLWRYIKLVNLNLNLSASDASEFSINNIVPYMNMSKWVQASKQQIKGTTTPTCLANIFQRRKVSFHMFLQWFSQLNLNKNSISLTYPQSNIHVLYSSNNKFDKIMFTNMHFWVSDVFGDEDDL